jgi:hypothetical protein
MHNESEWRAFFRQFFGRDMPDNAAYQAARHRREAAAPPDVGGLQAAFDEQPWNDLSGLKAAAGDEMEAVQRGITVEEVRAEQLEQEARDRAQEEDAFGLPGELWLRSLPGAAEAGPYQPAEALARFQAGRAAMRPQALLYRTSDGELKPLIDPDDGTRFTAYAFVGSSSGRGWAGACLGEGLAWYDAVEAAERASRIPEASFASVDTDSHKEAFLFIDGTAVGPAFPLPWKRSDLTAEELAALAAAPGPAGPADRAVPRPSLARPRDFPCAIQEALGMLGIRRRAAAAGRRLGGGGRRLGL